MYLEKEKERSFFNGLKYMTLINLKYYIFLSRERPENHELSKTIIIIRWKNVNSILLNKYAYFGCMMNGSKRMALLIDT